MRKRQNKKSACILALLAVGAFTLTLHLGTVGAFAQQDADDDGFIETNPITLPADMSLAAYGTTFLFPCSQAPVNTPRDACVDPNTKDLFVIIQRAATPCPTQTTCGDPCGPPLFDYSDIPMPPEYPTTYDPLALIYPGLQVTTHELIGGSTQFIQEGTTGGWFAIKIVESLDPCSPYMGLSIPGVPKSPGGKATVWPEKIINWIDKICSQACFDLDGDEIAETCYTPYESNSFYCKNSLSGRSVDMKSNPDLSQLYYEFIQNVFNHEVSHNINLASGSGTSADFHWPIAYGYLMEQFIGTKVTKTKKTPPDINVILYISTGYNRQDKARFRLK